MTKFEPGLSANPAGRAPGIRDKRSAMRDLLLPHAPELVTKAVEMAKAGDTAALRICLDRLIPPAKARDDPVTLPALDGSLADCARIAVTALAAGDLTPDETGTILQALASQARIIDADEIEKRITALEQAAAKGLGGTRALTISSRPTHSAHRPWRPEVRRSSHRPADRGPRLAP